MFSFVKLWQELTQPCLIVTGTLHSSSGRKLPQHQPVLQPLQAPTGCQEPQPHLGTPPLTGATTVEEKGSVVGRPRFNTQHFDLILQRWLTTTRCNWLNELFSISRHLKFNVSICKIIYVAAGCWNLLLGKSRGREKTVGQHSHGHTGVCPQQVFAISRCNTISSIGLRPSVTGMLVNLFSSDIVIRAFGQALSSLSLLAPSAD